MRTFPNLDHLQNLVNCFLAHWLSLPQSPHIFTHVDKQTSSEVSKYRRSRGLAVFLHQWYLQS